MISKLKLSQALEKFKTENVNVGFNYCVKEYEGACELVNLYITVYIDDKPVGSVEICYSDLVKIKRLI